MAAQIAAKQAGEQVKLEPQKLLSFALVCNTTFWEFLSGGVMFQGAMYKTSRTNMFTNAIPIPAAIAPASIKPNQDSYYCCASITPNLPTLDANPLNLQAAGVGMGLLQRGASE